MRSMLDPLSLHRSPIGSAACPAPDDRAPDHGIGISTEPIPLRVPGRKPADLDGEVTRSDLAVLHEHPEAMRPRRIPVATPLAASHGGQAERPRPMAG